MFYSGAVVDIVIRIYLNAFEIDVSIFVQRSRYTRTTRAFHYHFNVIVRGFVSMPSDHKYMAEYTRPMRIPL